MSDCVKMVCPMRFVLVIVSTFIAGYLAWTSWKQLDGPSIMDAEEDAGLRKREKVRAPNEIAAINLFHLLRCAFQMKFSVFICRHLCGKRVDAILSSICSFCPPMQDKEEPASWFSFFSHLLSVIFDMGSGRYLYNYYSSRLKAQSEQTEALSSEASLQ